MGANKGHGERMSNADKRHSVMMALEDEELSQKTDREIADQCRVSHMTVNRIRGESVTLLQDDQSSPKEKASDSKSSEIERLEKELAEREEFEKKREAEIEATIAERVQEELAKQSEQSNDDPPRDEELEHLRQQIAERDESERQLREEVEALKNAPAPDIEATIAERVQEELAKRPEQPTDEEIERLRQELAEREEAEQEREERERRLED